MKTWGDGAKLKRAEMSNAHLSGAFYSINNVPTWASGMDPVALGTVALEPAAVPEPATLRLALFTLALLPLRPRTQRRRK